MMIPGEGAEAVEAGETETLGALVTENLADLIVERDRVSFPAPAWPKTSSDAAGSPSSTSFWRR